MKKIIIHHRSPHHAKNSGYGRLIDYLDDSIVVKGTSKIPYRLAKFIGDLTKPEAGLYDSNSVKKEFELYRYLKDYKNPAVVHYLNAERDIRYLVKVNKNRQVKFVGTFHKPPNILAQSITNTKYLKQLNAAICVGSNQVDFIKNWLNLEQVTYIPHGVDTQFFVPDRLKISQRPHLLFVGQHLRDFEMFNKCIPQILNRKPDAEVTVVLKKNFVNKIVKHNNIKVYSQLSDDQLKRLYQTAHILFLPLLNSTACNSILEAMSSGLPIITSSLDCVNEYLEGTGNLQCKSGEEFIGNTIELLDSVEQQIKISEASRLKALTYDWSVVAEQVKTFYKEII